MGGALGLYETACLLSFEASGFQVSLYEYSPTASAPGSINILDAREIAPAPDYLSSADYRKTPSGFSNIFRYRMLNATDKIWVDTDVMSLGEPLPNVGGYCFGWESSKHINGAVLGAPQKSAFVSLLLRRAEEVNRYDAKWGDLGPKLVTRVVTEMEIDGLAQPRHCFYPLDWSEIWKAWDPRYFDELTVRLQGSATIHLWNEVIRRSGLPMKEYLPPKGSWMRKKFEDIGLITSSMDNLPSEVVRYFRQYSRQSLISRTRRAMLEKLRSILESKPQGKITDHGSNSGKRGTNGSHKNPT